MISSAILKTLKYSDHFGFPLTINEILLRLVGAKSSRPLVQKSINELIKNKQIEKTEKYYYLPGHKSLIASRLYHAKTSLSQLTRAKAISSQLSHLPGVIAIYLTGSLAMCNSDKDSDIDLMIITANSKLWTTRIILTIYTELLGLRRRPYSIHSSGKICLNLYLTPNSYELPSTKKNLYTAYELVQAVPLYDPYDTHTQMLATNSWIKKYLPNYPFPIPQRPDLVCCKPDQKPTRPDSIGILENILYHLQLAYMRPKLTREYITKDSAFFHPNDPGVKVLQKLKV